MGQKQSVPAAAELPASATNNDSNGNGNGNIQEALGQQQQQNIAAMIESQSNPSEADAASHNYGQPILPPHHSSSTSPTTNAKKKGASKLVTDCSVQQRASLKCIEENYQNKDQACAGFFEAYKTCRREEHERKLEANKSAW